MEALRAALEQATRGTAFELSRADDGRLKLVAPGDASFASGGFALQPALRRVLDVLASSLADAPAARIAVVGHSDASGAAPANDTLSLDRAQSVRDYLVGRGASAQRIEVAGRGAREPVADNAGSAGRARNRRVEVLVRE